MSRPYSTDLRDRVAASVSNGRSCRETARLFGVSVATVVRCSQRFRSTGSAAAKSMGGRRRLLLLPQRDWLLARLAVVPDLTLRAVQAELAARGVKVGYGTVWWFLRSEGLTFKKKPARRGARPSGRHPQARPMEALSGAH
jgi:transposase